MNMKTKVIFIALAGTMALSAAPFAGAITSATFHDVQLSDWYYSAVNHVVERNYFNGVGANTFAPHQGITRAMAVTVLSRMFGGDLSSYTGKTDFTDVPVNAYYAKAVQWAVEQGIASGTSPTTFSPDSYATREQISVFLYNAVRAFGDLGSFNGITLNTFSDKDRVSSWANIALQWATSNNIINGDGGQVKPQNSTTRAAFATIVMNYNGRHPGGGTTPVPDPGPTPTPSPKPSEDEFVAAAEDEINGLLVSTWGASHAPARDTDKLTQAAHLIASEKIKNVEQALKEVGFDQPIGSVQYDQYTANRYDAQSAVTVASSVQQAMVSLKQQDSVMVTDNITEYGVGVCKINDIQFRVAVVTYNSNPHEVINRSQITADWLSEQATTPANLSDIEQQIVDLTNKEREKYGLAPLKTSSDMQKAAKVRAKEAAVAYNHVRPNGQLFQSVYVDIDCLLYRTSPISGEAVCCTTACCENLAGGVYTPEEVVAAWMNSQGHRENILNPNITHIGAALEPRMKNGVQQGYYWVQCFIGIDY